jgi:hypothetical protein
MRSLNRIVAIVAMICLAAESRRPVHLLVPDETRTRLVIDRRGIEALRGIGDGPVAVVTFIGRARTGKSFTLNRLLGVSHDEGFEVGHSDKPKTVGMLVWPDPVASVDAGCNFTYVVIDTEGIGTGVQTYDKALLTMALVISSRFVYHLDKYVYFDDTTKLYSIAQLATHYERRRMLGSSEKRGALLPPLTWVVQQYRFEHGPGEGTPLDVLNNVWLREEENPTDDRRVGTYNATVRVVRRLFPSHSVYLIPPATEASHSRLTDVPDDQLSEGYRSEIDRLRSEVFGCSRTVPRGIGLTGNDVADLVTEVIEPANLGVDYVGDKVADIVARNHAAEKIAEMEAEMGAIALPLSERDLDDRLGAIRRRSEDALVAGMPLFDGGERTGGSARFIARPHLDDMGERYAILRALASERNSAASDVACAAAADSVSPSVSSPDAIRSFSGDLGAFDRAFDAALSRYDAAAVGPRTEFHRRTIHDRARSARIAVASEGAPRRRMSWAMCSVAAAVLCHALSSVVSRIDRTGKLLIAIAAIELSTTVLAIAAAWSIAGNPPFDFDRIADSLVSLARMIASVGFIVAMAAVGASLAIASLAYRRTHPQVSAH